MGILDNAYKAYDIRSIYPTKTNEAMAWKVGHVRGCVLDPFAGSGVCLDGDADRCIFVDEREVWDGS